MSGGDGPLVGPGAAPYNRCIMSRWTLLSLWWAAASLALGAQERSRITITTLDRSFAARKIEIRAGTDGLTLVATDESDAVAAIPGIDVVEVGFAPVTPRTSPGPDDVEILLRTGDRIVGTLGEPREETVQVASASLGPTSVPFARIDQVRFLARRAEWPKVSGQITRDTLYTASGDRPTGTIRSLGRGEIVYIHARRDRETKLATKDAVAASFVPIPPEPPAPPSTLYAIVQLTDGSELRGTPKSYGNAGLVFTDLYGGERTVSAAGVAGLYFKNGRVIYLSDLSPSKVEENANYIRMPEPLPGDLSYPYQRDAGAGDGGRLLIRGKEFRKGLGVHARSALTYTLDGAYSKFQATVGIDDYAVRLSGLDPVGNVSFVVLGDGQVLERRDGITSKSPPIILTVDVKGRKELTLLVDFGEDRSGQGDFADWALARVIR
jgi:hypothetical protein